MNRFTNIIIRTLQTSKSTHHHKIKCEVHYGEDGLLTIPIQPIIRNGFASFCDQKIRIPFSQEVNIVFKFVMPNKKEALMGHYEIQVQKILKEKLFHFKVKDKLEEYDAWIDFQFRIIDKQLLYQSENNESELQEENHLFENDKSIVSHDIYKIRPLKFKDSPTEINTPINARRQINVIPFAPEEFHKVIREAQDIIKKHQVFSQRENILSMYKRDNKGMLKTDKIIALQNRLEESRKALFLKNIFIYIAVSAVAFFIGLQL